MRGRCFSAFSGLPFRLTASWVYPMSLRPAYPIHPSVRTVAPTVTLSFTNPVRISALRPLFPMGSANNSSTEGSSEAARVEPPLVGIAVVLDALAHFHGSDDGGLVVNAPALPARLTAHVTFVDFHGPLRADAVAFRVDHPGPEFVQDLKGGLVPLQSELPLELDGTHAGGLSREVVCGAEPHGEGRMRLVQNRPCREGDVALVAALAATEDHGRTGIEPEWLALPSAVGADETIREPDRLQVTGARRVIGENPVEIPVVGGELRKGAGRHALNLTPGGRCVN